MGSILLEQLWSNILKIPETFKGFRSEYCGFINFKMKINVLFSFQFPNLILYLYYRSIKLEKLLGKKLHLTKTSSSESMFL